MDYYVTRGAFSYWLTDVYRFATTVTQLFSKLVNHNYGLPGWRWGSRPQRSTKYSSSVWLPTIYTTPFTGVIADEYSVLNDRS